MFCCDGGACGVLARGIVRVGGALFFTSSCLTWVGLVAVQCIRVEVCLVVLWVVGRVLRVRCRVMVLGDGAVRVCVSLFVCDFVTSCHHVGL